MTGSSWLTQSITLSPLIWAISTVPFNKSHWLRNSPICSRVTSSSKIISSPGTKSLLAYVISSDCCGCCCSCCATSSPSSIVSKFPCEFVLVGGSSFSLLLFPFPVTTSSAPSKALSTVCSTFRSTFLSVARLALSPAFLRSFFPHWACTSIVPIRSNMADKINTSFFISFNSLD